MQGHNEGTSPINATALRNVRLVYDLIYNPLETRLLKDAKAAGCQTLGGMAMLLGQAAEQFRLWTGEDAQLDVMWQAIATP
jgi:shikimate 5-dehydrogenase